MDLLRVKYDGCTIFASAPKFKASVGNLVKLEGNDKFGTVEGVARLLDDDVIAVLAPAVNVIPVLAIYEQNWEEDDAGAV